MVNMFKVATASKTAVYNVTDQVSEQIKKIDEGLAVISVPHTTASILISEDDEELRVDIARVARNLFSDCRPFAHSKRGNPNAEAHILSAFSGTSVSIPIIGGKLDLGTYQNILLLEMDGPKQRMIKVMVLRN